MKSPAKLLVYSNGNNERFLILYPPGKERQAKRHVARWKTRADSLNFAEVEQLAGRIEAGSEIELDSEQTGLEDINRARLHQELFGKA